MGSYSLDKWTIFKSPLGAAQVPLQPDTASGAMLIFGRLLGTVTDQGFDASSQGSRSSSPQILPRQISVSGWGWSVENNSSTASSGVRSAVESTSTWKKGEKKQEVRIKGTDRSTNEM